VPFHLLCIKKLLLNPWIFLRFYHGQEIICTPPPFSSLDPKSQSFCHHFASVVHPSTITKMSSPLKPLDQLRPNFGGMVLGWSPSNIVSDSPDLQPPWPLLLKIKRGTKFKNIFISETTEPIRTKFCLDSPWMIPFQICVRQSRPPTNMATVAKNRKRGMKFKIFPLWNYWANWIQALLK
jgi:hypothetical protein